MDGGVRGGNRNHDIIRKDQRSGVDRRRSRTGQDDRACVSRGVRAPLDRLRTRDGRQEVDLIVERGDHRIVGMEVKLGADVTDRDVRHLLWLRDALGDDVLDLVVITTGTIAYRRKGWDRRGACGVARSIISERRR